ncbi:hypothetical protein N7510_001975 [Penicillium lagena]|uniref:uncharacterized protein n=1 Tax=Penicillium lagena TaxID=94218 RepID=UPI00254058EB|nr:uncharacterized protein N7510_001975 [Penicillium lagena]KAJ5625666.1 hypothetical protein N7510_001975 [Penicillium lagena]
MGKRHKNNDLLVRRHAEYVSPRVRRFSPKNRTLVREKTRSRHEEAVVQPSAGEVDPAGNGYSAVTQGCEWPATKKSFVENAWLG